MWFDPDDLAPVATMADAHAEWHRNARVPMGTPGCPQDACHDDYDDYEGHDDPRVLGPLHDQPAPPYVEPPF